MRYRRFGQSDLVVSEVGLRHLDARHRLVGPHRRPARDDHAPRSTRASTSSTPRPSTAPSGAGESILAPYLTGRDDIVITTKCGYDIKAERKFPGQSERPARLAAGVDPAAVRRLAPPARHRPHRPLPAPQPPYRADPRRRPLGDADRPAERGQGPRARRRARPGDRLGRRGHPRDRRPPDRVAADRVQRARAGAGPDVRASGRACSRATSSLISRVPHASDTLSGKVTPDTVFPKGDHRAHRNRDNMLDNFEKAETLVVPLGAGHRPHDGAGRDRRHPRQHRVHVRAADGAVGRRRAASTQPRPTCRSRADEHDAARRAVVAQLRPRRPLRHAAEVERAERCDAPSRRPTSPAAARRRARPSSRSTGFHAHVDGRHRGGARASPSRCSTSISRASGRSTASCSKTPAAGCSTHARRRDEPRRRRAASASKPASARTSSFAVGDRAVVPAAVRRVDPHRSRVRAHRRRRPRRRRRHHLDTHRDPGLRRAARGARERARRAWPRRSVGGRSRITEPGVDADDPCAVDRRVRLVRPPRRAGRRTDARRSQLAEPNPVHAVVAALLEHEMRPPAVGSMFSRRLTRLTSRHTDCAERRACPPRVYCVRKLKNDRGSCSDVSRSNEQPVDVPGLEVVPRRIDVDREVEEVGDDHARLGPPAPRRRLQHVHAFDDHDVGAAQHDLLAVDDVVREVRVLRRPHLGFARLQLGEELHQPPDVVALGKALAAHQPARFEHRVGNRKPSVVTRSTRGWSGQRASSACRMRAIVLLPDRDAARDADDVRHAGVQRDRETSRSPTCSSRVAANRRFSSRDSGRYTSSTSLQLARAR